MKNSSFRLPARLAAASFAALSLFAALPGLRAQAADAAPATTPPPPTSTLYKDPSQPLEARVEDLLKQLTLEEKISLIHGQSTFSIAGIPRFGIPEHWTSDGPHGVRSEINRNSFADALRATDLTDASTAFPCGIAVAATWNPAVAHAVGEAIGQEARARGKDMMLGPAVNIERTPLNGRSFEYYGEDPWLSGRIAVGFIQGEQSAGVASCVKHYAANNQETQRGSINVLMDERTLREIYLPAFEATVKDGHVLTLMAAYNKFRGTYCAENDYLMNQVLKGDWGFTGAVMTDWGASHTTKGSALGGLDLEMGTKVGNGQPFDYDATYHLAAPFRAGIQDGTYPVALLDDKVRRNLRVLLAINLLNPELRPAGSINTPTHQNVDLQAAEESMVLLKNTGNALPLDASAIKSIAVIGDNATHLQASGGQSSGIKAFHETSPLDGLKAYLGDKVNITFTQGYTSGGRGGGRGGRRGGAAAAPAAPVPAPAAGTVTPPTVADGNTAPITVAAAAAGAASTPLLDAAAAAAKAADVAIVFVGLNKQFDTEGSDRRDLKLPYGQDDLIARVVAANPRTIVVLVAGSPVEMGSWLEKTPAVLLSWYGGSEAGNAIARTLFGAVNPSGKLPCTFPKLLADTPAVAGGPEAYPGQGGIETYKEGLLVGYRWFDTKSIEPLFPFGHGLSYTTFNYSNLRVVPGGANGAAATAQFDVTNSGSRDGAEVAQLYLHQASPSLPRPDKELKGFQKISLHPGETQTVSIPLGARAFAFYDPEKKGWVAEAGDYQVIVGSSSRDLRLKGNFALGQTLNLPVTAGF